VSTVRDADVILYLRNGAIAERGTHAELIAQGGLYFDLFRRQQLALEVETLAHGIIPA
jgi:ABC-type multidrug transport system fused ATPase/permease subunit